MAASRREQQLSVHSIAVPALHRTATAFAHPRMCSSRSGGRAWNVAAHAAESSSALFMLADKFDLKLRDVDGWLTGAAGAVKHPAAALDDAATDCSWCSRLRQAAKWRNWQDGLCSGCRCASVDAASPAGACHLGTAWPSPVVTAGPSTQPPPSRPGIVPRRPLGTPQPLSAVCARRPVPAHSRTRPGRLPAMHTDGGEPQPSLSIDLERCTVRPWQLTDATSMAEALNDKSVWLCVRNRIAHPYTLEHARQFLEAMAGWQSCLGAGCVRAKPCPLAVAADRRHPLPATLSFPQNTDQSTDFHSGNVYTHYKDHCRPPLPEPMHCSDTGTPRGLCHRRGRRGGWRRGHTPPGRRV